MTNIFVAKLDYGVTNEELKSLFETYGKVSKVSIPTDKETGKPKGFAFVEMFNNDEALLAIKSLDQKTINGRQIAVKLADNKPVNKDNRKESSSNFSGTKKFNKPESNSSTENTSIPKIEPQVPIIDKKRDVFKKKDKKVNFDDNKPRQKKMETYKKSGKNNRFLDFDNDDEFY